MKKFYLLFIGFSMILMSCENISEKVNYFNAEFENAVKEDNIDKAEQIANEAKAYRSDLSESKQEAYDRFVDIESFDAIIAAKKFNRKFHNITGKADYDKSGIIEEDKIPLLLQLRNEIAAYRKKLKDKACGDFNVHVYDVEYKIVESKAARQGTDYCIAFDERNEQKMNQIEKAIRESIASIEDPEYKALYEGTVELAKETYLSNLQKLVDEGKMTEAQFNSVKKALLK